MMSGAKNFRDLLQRLEHAFSSQPSSTDLASLQHALQAARSDFINLLRYKGPNAESRSQIQSRAPMTPAGQVVLDEEPDVREVLLLADEVQLDEVLALLCILAVRDEVGEVSAAAAAGLYFEERRALLSALWMLLQAQVVSTPGTPPELFQLVCATNSELVSLERGGRTVLVERLVELIRGNPLEVSSSSRLAVVVDTHGREVERSVLVMREQTLLCECLLYAVCIKQRLSASDISALVDLVHHLALKIRGSPSTEFSLQQQGYLALLSTLLALAPLENAEPAEAEADARALDALARDAALGNKICALDPSDPHCATLKLAWGVLLSQYGPESAQDRAAEQVNAALGAGALGWLRSGVVLSVPMQDDAEHQRELCASVLNQLLMNFLDSAVGREAVESLTAASVSQGQQEVAAAAASTMAGQAAAGALVVADAGAGAASGAGAPKPDNLASLLSLLGSVLGMYPALFLDESLRYDVLGVFMGHLAAHEALQQAPSVFVAYMDVLTALAAGEKGARAMYQQLRPDNSFEALTWRRMFGVLAQYIRLYMPPEGEGGAAGGGGAGAGAVQQRPADFVIPACDSLAMCAYLRLFSRVMSEGQPDEVASWVRQLEEEAGMAPIWEVLFQLMCCPVPQELKAALDNAIASLARRPDIAALLLERVLAAVVVAMPTAGPGGAGTVPRYDITYQLNEIEARGEEYSEAIAFVRLLNALWRALEGALPGEGRPVAHLTAFVKDDVLGTVFQRTYREERQCWELAAACLEHCRLCLEGFNAAGAAEAGPAKPPGYDVLVDILGERAVMRALMRTLLSPVEVLAHDRHAAPYGESKEGAVLAALRLLVAVLDCDLDFVGAMRRATLTASYESMDSVLRHDRSRIPRLLDYVRYPHNPDIQVAALRIAAHLADRLPDLVHLLPDDLRLLHGFAGCLQDSLLTAGMGGAGERAEGGEGGAGEAGISDPRASLSLDLLLGALDQPSPNFTQLLAGFNFDAGMNFVSPPPGQFNVLRVVLEALHSRPLQATRPELYEQCLELVHALAAAADTGPAMLDMLRCRTAGLISLLDDVALGPLPSCPAARAASLNQRACLLKLVALELHHSDMALVHHAAAVTEVLSALFGQPGDGGPGSASGESRMLRLLRMIVGFGPLDKPQLGQHAAPEVRRILQSLEADTLFAGEAGTSAISPRGYVVYDVRAVKNALLQRYNDWVSRHGPPNDALKEACRLCLAFAQESNAFIDEVAGQMSLATTWCSVVTIAFSRRGGALVSACASVPALELVLGGIEDVLGAAAKLLGDGRDTLAAPLCDVLGVLLACLQERVASRTAPPTAPGPPALPLVELIPPSRCLEVLEALLATAWEGRRCEGVRLPLYTALSTLLSVANQAEAPAGPPAVVEALLQGSRPSGGSASELDALQTELEQGAANILLAHARVLGMLASDALSSNLAQAAVALTTLIGVVGADPSGALAAEVHALGLPGQLLQDLAGVPASLFSERSATSGARLQVVQLQLSLLNRLCLAGPSPTDGPQKLLLAQALVRLSSFQLLGVQPEDPYAHNLAGVVSQRRRLHGILAPTLRLVLGILQPLPRSGPAREQGLRFVEAHARTLGRVMHDACHGGTRNWSPGPQELEQAELVAQLLGEVVPEAASLPVWPQLHEAFARLASRFLWPATTSPPPPALPLLGPSAMEEDAQRGDLQAHTRGLGLRCALALCLYKAGLAASLFPFSTDPATGHPLLFVKSALAQVVLRDIPYLLDADMALPPTNAGKQASGQDSDAEFVRGVLAYRTSLLCEVLVSLCFELQRAQAQEALPPLEGKRGEELRGVLMQLEQVMQRGGALLKYSDSLPLLLRRAASVAR